jgi:hypothetical protein
LSGNRVTGGSTTVISISRGDIKVEEIQFLSVPGSNAIQVRHHLDNANISPPEWEYDFDRRLIRRQSPYMTGIDVEEVQDSLIILGYSVGSCGADGMYGDDTERAVRRFQDAHGLLLDGIVGPETRSLGCELYESEMGDNFRCNEVISIGYNTWAVPFGTGFNYHEVAWIGAYGNSNEM